jgi:hypothetical protein
MQILNKPHENETQIAINNITLLTQEDNRQNYCVCLLQQVESKGNVFII